MDPQEITGTANKVHERMSQAIESFLEGYESLHVIEEKAYERLDDYISKLVVLAGATIPLSFTALGLFWSKVPRGYHFGYLGELFWAWSLLVATMVLCMAAKKLNVYAIALGRTLNHAKLLSQRRDLIVAMVEQTHGRAFAQTAPTILDEESLKSAAAKGHLLGCFRDIILYAAEALGVASFVLLLIFIETNIKGIVGG